MFIDSQATATSCISQTRWHIETYVKSLSSGISDEVSETSAAARLFCSLYNNNNNNTTTTIHTTTTLQLRQLPTSITDTQITLYEQLVQCTSMLCQSLQNIKCAVRLRVKWMTEIILSVRIVHGFSPGFITFQSKSKAIYVVTYVTSESEVLCGDH